MRQGLALLSLALLTTSGCADEDVRGTDDEHGEPCVPGATGQLAISDEVDVSSFDSLEIRRLEGGELRLEDRVTMDLSDVEFPTEYSIGGDLGIGSADFAVVAWLTADDNPGDQPAADEPRASAQSAGTGNCYELIDLMIAPP